jgi:YbbR domain-containing protein
MLLQIVRKNFGLKVLSLALAIVGWAYFRYASNPIIATARFDQQFSVPITAANLQEGYIAHFLDKQAVVTVETRRGEAAVKPDEIKAVLDLSNKGTGVYNVPVLLVAPNIAVQSLSPASVSLTIEKIDERPFPVVVHYTGGGPGAVVVSDSTLDPGAVSVHGPTSLLSQVAAVRVDVPLPSSPKHIDFMVRPEAVNSLGEEVSGLEIAPDLVRVQMQFVQGEGATTQP